VVVHAVDHVGTLQAKQVHHQQHKGTSQQQQQQQQLLQEEPSLQSVNSLSMFPDPSAGAGCSSKRTAGAGSGVLSSLIAARLQEERQHALVVSACKALGSSAAADAYVAALPAGLLAVNLSAAGVLWALVKTLNSPFCVVKAA
jgi:hypothetical protein